MAEHMMNTAVAEKARDSANGQIKCPKCGATDIQTNTKTGKLRCNFCRHEFELIRAADDEAIETLVGSTVRSGAQDIDADADDIITLKCESCGAEVVIAASILRILFALDFFNGTQIQENRDIVWFLLVGGFVYFFAMVKKYRNQDARHTYEFETKNEVTHLDCVDEFLYNEHGVTTSRIAKENSTDLIGNDLKKIEKRKKKKDKK